MICIADSPDKGASELAPANRCLICKEETSQSDYCNCCFEASAEQPMRDILHALSDLLDETEMRGRWHCCVGPSGDLWLPIVAARSKKLREQARKLIA